MINFIIGLFVFGVFTVDAVVLGGEDSTSSLKRYSLENGKTLHCKTRDLKDACPLDHEIQPCRDNLTQVVCHPCDIMAGYRTCIQVYSAIDYVECYRPAILCKPEELLVLHIRPDGRCYNASCVKDCGSTEGFVQRGFQCVPQCGVNTSLSNGTCQPCPKGTYKPETSEKCTKIPVSKQELPNTENTHLNKTEPSDKQTNVTSGEIKGGRDTRPELSTTESANNTLAIILSVTLPCAVVLVLVIVLVCFLYHKDRRTGHDRVPVFRWLCNTIKSEGHAPVNGGAIRPVSDVETDLERAGIAPDEALMAEETIGPLASMNAAEECTYPSPASGGVPPQDNPEVLNPATDFSQPLPDKPEEEKAASPSVMGDIDATNEERAPLISRPSSESNPRFPTLITKEGSSLLPQTRSDRLAVHMVTDPQPAGGEVKSPSHSEAVSAFTEDQRDREDQIPQKGIGLVELSEDLKGSSNTLDNFTFGSHLRDSSITDISNSV